MKYIREKSRKWTRGACAALAGLFCAAALVLFQTAVVRAEEPGTVTASSANVRSDADTSSSVIASVKSGDTVSIIEEVTGADGNVWYRIYVNADTQGYIRSDLVSKDGGNTAAGTTSDTGDTSNAGTAVSAEGVEAVQPVSASVTRDQVRVRADSSTNSSIVTMVGTDIVLTVQGTKAGTGSDVWYLVSFVIDGEEVTGFIRSDFVNLSGDLLPVTEEEEVLQDQTETVPETPVEETKDYETEEIEGVWYLLDYVSEPHLQYQISSLLTSAEQNATELENAQKQISRQNGIIIFLVILVVLMVLGITLLIFKLRDLKDEDGFEEMGPGARRGASGSASQRSARPAASAAGRKPVTRPAGARPSSGAGAEKSAGARPASAAGSRPGTGTRPGMQTAGSRPAGTKPAGSKPAGAKPAQPSAQGTKPENARPVQTQAAGDRQAKPRVKNFMADDDEFEFEFLNWDGDEEK